MKFSITMKKNVHDEILTLMQNISELNNGDEIGGWLLGDWVDKGDEMELVCDEFYIPKQEVSAAEVDISPESIIETIKDIGIDKSNRIKAHWHIHPFAQDTTNWSGTDETKIKDFMSPEKQREIFVFLLSSKTQLKARVELNYTATLLGKKFAIPQSIDGLPVTSEKNIDEINIFNRLKEMIASKITRPVNKTLTYYVNGGSKKEDERFEVDIRKEVVILTMTEEFGDWILNKAIVPPELMDYVNKKDKGRKVLLIYKPKTDLDTFATMLEDTMISLECQYEDSVKYSGYNSRYYGEAWF